MPSKSFIKSSFIYTVVGSLPLATSILLLPFYGNSSLLSTADFGLLAIYIILSELAKILFTFSADSFLGFNYIHYNNSKSNLQRFIGTTSVFMLVYGVLMLLLFCVLGGSAIKLLYPGKNISFYPFGFLSVLTGLLNGIFKAYSTLMIYREKPAPFLWSNIIHFTLVLAVSITGLYLYPQTLLGPIWGRFVGAIATFLWSLTYFISASRFKVDFNILKKLLSYSAPLYLFGILYWIVSNIDRYFILGLLSEKDVAIFDFAVKLTLAIEFLQNGLSSAIYPKIFQIWKKNDDVPHGNVEINRFFHVFALITVVGIPVLYLSVPLLVPLLVNNSELYASFNLLPLLFAGMVSRIWYYYLVAPIYYFKQTKVMPLVFGFAAIFQIASTYILIQLNGIDGAVWANLLTKLFQVFLLYLFVRRFYTLRVNVKKLIVFPAVYMMLLIAAEIFLKPVNIYLLNLIHIVIITVLAYSFFRNELKWENIRTALKK